MKKIKILIIDEDILVRRSIVNILNNHAIGGIREIRTSGNIDEGESIVQSENPDLLFLDMEGADSDGYTLFNTLRIRFPLLPIVVLGTRSEEGARAVMYGLRNGAVDFITKPEQNQTILFARRHLLKRLVPIVKTVIQNLDRKAAGKLNTDDTDRFQQSLDRIFDIRGNKNHKWPARLVVMGACMGGPKALFTALKHLPADMPVPVVIVQHFPRIYTQKLVQSLNQVSNLSVREAYDGAVLKPGTVWLARGGYHCEVEQNGHKPSLRVHRGPRERGVRPSIDVLFRSAGRIFGPEVLGVILSGHGSDGIAGAKAILNAGGEIIVQDPESAPAKELPLSVISAGITDHAFPVEQIGDEVLRRIAINKRNTRHPAKKYQNFESTQTDRIFLHPM